jgi:hypothetical protein
MNISEGFHDDIIEGVATHLAYLHGNLQTNGSWIPVEKPNATALASQIFDTLERNLNNWKHKRSAAKAIRACASVIKDNTEAERLVFLAIGFSRFYENDPVTGDNVSLIGLGINMAKGNIAEALMILATKFLESGNILPDLLVPTLRRFANDEHPAVRAMILQRLPYLQSKEFELGWDLFHIAMKDADGLWLIAEQCIYRTYYNHFEIVRPLLARLYIEGSGKDLQTWGRISALAAMSRHIDFAKFLRELETLDNNEAWHGAAAVWTNFENIQKHREQCIDGIHSGLKASAPCAEEVVIKMEHIFREKSAVNVISMDLIRHFFYFISTDSKSENFYVFGFDEWLNVISQQDPIYALSAAEIYLTYVRNSKSNIYDHNNSLTQLMTRLFSEAEEREASDSGEMLHRVVVVQDTLLSLGVNGVVDWLKAAERP